MDGEHRAYAPQGIPPAGEILPVHRHQRRLPIVAVEHLRHIVQQGQQVQNRPGKEAEALPVVPLAIEPAPGEVMLVIHKIPGDTPVLQGKQAAVLMPPGQIHIDMAAEGHLTAPLAGNGIIQRQDHRHAVPPGRQGNRKAPGYVRQAACFTKGGGLPRYIQNIHLTPPRFCPRPWGISRCPPGARQGRCGHSYPR